MPFKKIVIGKLQVGMNISRPIYINTDGKNVLLMSENTLIRNELQKRRLIDAGIQTVEIDTDKGIDTIKSLLNQQKWTDLVGSLKDQGISETMLSRHIQKFVATFTGVISKNYTSRMLISDTRVAYILKEVLKFVRSNTDLLMSLIRLNAINKYTFSHSVNVTVMLISLAQKLKLDSAHIARLSTGALVADIGMTNFPPTMIRRPSGLSKKELQEIEKHPEFTLQFLDKVGIHDDLIETLVLQHHERYDGSGYPKGLKGDELHPASKLFAIADVYIAMTSPRPHRSGLPPHMVHAHILEKSGILFDPAIAKLFIRHIGVFPAGNMVELTNGDYALVAVPNKKDPLRPVVILFKTKKKLRKAEKIKNHDDGDVTIVRNQWKLVDLTAGNGNFGRIKRGLDHRTLGIKPNSYLDQI